MDRRKKRLMILDPDLVTKVLITDFDYFVDNTFFSDKYMKVRCIKKSKFT